MSRIDSIRQQAFGPSGDPGGFVMPFGKYKGESLTEICYDGDGTARDDGLLYLDWVQENFSPGNVLTAVEAFLDQWQVHQDLLDAHKESGALDPDGEDWL